MTTCVPHQIVENSTYDVIPSSEREWFIRSIGIERRRVAPQEVCASDLCEKAAEHLLAKIGWAKDDIELLIFITQTPDYRMPATSCVLQERLGLPKGCMTIDVSQGCSGYVYGLSIIGSLLSTGSIRRGLLLVGNTQSKNINYKDKSVYPLFSDAGSATAFEYSDDGDVYHLSYLTDGSKAEVIMIPDGGYRNPISSKSYEEIEDEVGGSWRNRLNLRMIGDEVFPFVGSNVPKATKALFEQYEIDKNKIDYFMIHHASKFIIDKLIRKMELPIEKVPLQLRDFGNASNASIPLIMCTSLHDDVTKRALSLYVSGFGVGLSLGVGVLSIDKLICADLIEM